MRRPPSPPSRPSRRPPRAATPRRDAGAGHHAAVIDELAEVGYVGFTIESVAARAHTAKASIYRRCRPKQHS